jgi:hypothetical protein
MKINKCSNCGESHNEVSIFEFLGQFKPVDAETNYMLRANAFICPKDNSIVPILDSENKIELNIINEE